MRSIGKDWEVNGRRMYDEKSINKNQRINKSVMLEMDSHSSGGFSLNRVYMHLHVVTPVVTWVLCSYFCLPDLSVSNTCIGLLCR